MVGEMFAGVSALKSAFDIARSIKDIADDVARKLALSDLLDKLISAREDQDALLKRVSALETENASLKTWEAEKQKYELKDVGRGVVAYMLKPAHRGETAAHWLCPTCFAKSQKAYFQPTGALFQRLTVCRCNGCQANVSTLDGPKWIG